MVRWWLGARQGMLTSKGAGRGCSAGGDMQRRKCAAQADAQVRSQARREWRPKLLRRTTGPEGAKPTPSHGRDSHARRARLGFTPYQKSIWRMSTRLHIVETATAWPPSAVPAGVRSHPET